MPSRPEPLLDHPFSPLTRRPVSKRQAPQTRRIETPYCRGRCLCVRSPTPFHPTCPSVVLAKTVLLSEFAIGMARRSFFLRCRRGSSRFGPPTNRSRVISHIPIQKSRSDLRGKWHHACNLTQYRRARLGGDIGGTTYVGVWGILISTSRSFPIGAEPRDGRLVATNANRRHRDSECRGWGWVTFPGV